MKTWKYLCAAALLLVSCQSRVERYYPGGGNNNGGSGGNAPVTVQVTEHPEWTATYRNRTDVEQQDGSTRKMEEFLCNYTGQNRFVLRTISPADFEQFYGEDIKSFIDEEAGALTQDDPLYTKTDKSLYFDILVHGDYYVYLIEVNASRKPTYHYSRETFTVIQEDPDPAYQAWLGQWTVTDGHVGYDIEVSPIENNYYFRVDGWETGSAAGSLQMNAEDDWLEARFQPEDGTLSFFIQFIAEVDNFEGLGKADLLFVGTYAESAGEVVDDFEGWEVACAKFNGQGDATISAGYSEFELNGKYYHPAFNSMRYSYYVTGRKTWVHAHEIIPEFPLSMYPLGAKAEVSVDRTPVHTRGYLRRTRLRQSVTPARLRGQKEGLRPRR